MSKKLVKTAKRQFEERLCDLHVGKRLEITPNEVYYHCADPDTGWFFLLREQGEEYKELRYGNKYENVVLGERFLSMMTERLALASQSVKPLFDWYASADHEDEPFTLLDIYMCDVENSDFYFEDIYEDVPDEPQIITAREQWERDSAGAETIQTLANGSVYKVAVTDGSITFFVHQDGGEYFREIYPAFDELRKDVSFVTAYLSHVQNTHGEDMDAALAWLQGGEYTMSKVSLLDIYQVGEDIDHLCYHDKEEPTAEVTKQDFKEEMDALRQKMIAHIVELCKVGRKLNVEVLCQNTFFIYTDGCYTNTDSIKYCWLDKDTDGTWVLYWTADASYHERLEEFSIETLRAIIDALQ